MLGGRQGTDLMYDSLDCGLSGSDAGVSLMSMSSL